MRITLLEYPWRKLESLRCGAVNSQGRAPQSSAGAVGSGISYQGFLNDSSGNPLVGSHQFLFELYNAPSDGDRLWQQNYNNVNVYEGLVDLVLDVDAGAFNGQALWLAVTVDGQLLTPRQELLPAPYALSVRPGAKVIGDTSGPILTIHNDDNVGIFASSNNESPLVGKIDNTDSLHSAVAGLTAGGGNGVFGMSEGGYGVYGHTNDDTEWEAAGVHGFSVHNNTFGVLGVSEWGIGLEGKIDNPENSNPAIIGYSQGEGPAIYAYGRDDATPDLVLGGNDEQDDGLLTSDLGLPSSDMIMASNDAVVVAPDDNDDEEGHFVVVNGADEITLLSDEYGNTEVKGDLTVQGNLYASGRTCAQYGPYTAENAYDLPVPSYCVDQMCWIIVQGDAIIGAFYPGLYWPVLYMQNSADDHWVGGPAVLRFVFHGRLLPVGVVLHSLAIIICNTRLDSRQPTLHMVVR